MVLVKEPHLLLDDYEELERIIPSIHKNNFSLLDNETGMTRYRGTLIKKSSDGKQLTIIGWQRNIVKIRGYGSQPAIITLTLDESGEIKEAELDKSFKGSKGVICSYNYLNNQLTSVIGKKLDKKFIKHTKLTDTHCFHITEVLRGIYSYYHLYTYEGFACADTQKIIFEEENLNSYCEDNLLYLTGLHFYNNKYLRYALRFEDIFNKAGFDRNAVLHFTDGIKTEFILNNEIVKKSILSMNDHNPECMNIYQFLTECLLMYQAYICPAGNIKIFNTNLIPLTIISLLTQALAVKMFKDNYGYIFHIMNSLQRINNIPACIGALAGQKEADVYFPQFKFADIF